MQKPNQPVLTNAGRQMLNDVAGSKGKITYTRAVMYGQDLSSMTIDQLRDLTTINDSKLETKIGVSDIKLETVTIIASFSNATVMQDTTYSAIGWYASTTVDSAEKLIAVIPYQQPQTLIAGSNGKATASTDIQLLIHIDDDVNVELKPIEEGLISEAELKNVLTLLSSKGLLYLGDEITDATYQADVNCFDKISNTSIKHINLKNITYSIPFPDNQALFMGFVKGGWLLTIADNNSKRFQILLDTDDNNGKDSINSIFTRTYTTQSDGTFKYGNWSKILNRETLFGEFPRYLYFGDPDDANDALYGGSVGWNVDGVNGKGTLLNLYWLLELFGYDGKFFGKSDYEGIQTGLYEQLFISHAKLMEILAPYGKVKSVNGTQPDEDGNVTLDIKGDIDKEIDDKRPTSLNFGTVENGQTFVNVSYPDNQFQLAKHNKSLYLDPVSFIDSLTYKDKMSDNLLVSHAQLIKALSEKVSKEDLNNAPFVKTASSTPVTLNPGMTSTGKTLIYKSPTGNPTDDVYLATENDLNQKVDKSSVYSKAETNTAIEKAKPTNIAFNTTGSETDRMGDLVPIKYDFNNIPHINLIPLAKNLTEVLLDHPELVHAIGLDTKADKSNVYSKDEAIKTFGKVKTVNNINPDNNGNIYLNAENITNAVRGTSRSKKQLEINPSVTIGSDRKGYMIRDGSDSFNLASTNDLDNKISKYVINYESDLSKYNLTDLNSLLRIPEGIYVCGNGSALFHSIQNIPSGLNPSQDMVIKIMDLEDPSKTQIQVIDVLTNTEIDTYKRKMYMNGNTWTSTSWYKFSGTKVD